MAAEAASRKAAQELQQQLQLEQEQKQKQAQEEEEEQRRLQRLQEESQKGADMNEDIDIWSDNFFGPISM